MNAAPEQAKARPRWPWLALCLATIALICAGQIYVATIADRAALTRELAVVKAGLTSRMREIAGASASAASRIEHLHYPATGLDAARAEQIIGADLRQKGFSAALITDRGGEPLYQMRTGSTGGPSGAELLAVARNDAIRLQTEAYAPADQPAPADQALSESTIATHTAVIGARLFVINTAPVLTAAQGSGGAVHTLTLVTAYEIGDSFLNAFGGRFLLNAPELHIAMTGAGAEKAFPARLSGEARILLSDGREQPVAAFDWRPFQPGADILAQTVVPISAGLLGLSAWAGLLYARERRSLGELIASAAQAAHMAQHDALTGLANRALLGDRLAYAIAGLRRDGRTFAIHCIDLDRFKHINDTYGHEAGDQLIRIVSERLSGTCRKIDTLARLGGDEFAIIQIDATPEAAAYMAERIVTMMAEPIDLAAGRLLIGASVGVSIIENGDIDPAEGLRQADLALYRAKDAGRGRYAFFNTEMDAHVRTRRALKDDLRAAIAADGLDLHYQPQVNINSQIAGLEALVRWKHPRLGSIPPSVFIPLAEESGLIHELGMLTLRRAFEDSRRWRHLRIAINISHAQLQGKDFVANVQKLVEEKQVDPRSFELEIAESLLLGEDSHTLATLNALRGLGFNIALDNFGTGYSKLSSLQNYPIDKIKIDRSFIAHLGIKVEADALVQAIVRLARGLSLSVVAEGVETESQRQYLTAAGCGNVQGYLFGKPASSAEILSLLREESPDQPVAAA